MLFGLRAGGALWDALRQASTAAGKPLADDFLRSLVLSTTGEAVRARLADQGVPDYTPSVCEGWFEQSSPAHRQVLERAWRSYVDGRVPMAQAVKQILEALPAESR